MVLDEGLGFEGVIGKGMTSYMTSKLVVDDDMGYVWRFGGLLVEEMAIGLGEVGIKGGC